MRVLPELNPKEAKRRTALYLDESFAEDLDNFAEEKNVSLNKAVIFLLTLALNSLETEEA